MPITAIQTIKMQTMSSRDYTVTGINQLTYLLSY